MAATVATAIVSQKVVAHAIAMKGVPVRYTGPSLYTQLAGGGDVLQAQSIMLKNIFAAGVVADSTGTYWIIPILSGPASSMVFMWVTIATGAEVNGAVDLDGFHADLMVWGN
jgi:hypothetical protein